MKHFFVTTLFFLVSFLAYSQSIRGRVVDPQKRPVEGAYILAMGSGEHVHTNHAGQFAIEGISVGDTLMVSHIGYESTLLVLQKLSQELRVQLSEKTISLDEVTINSRLDAINLFAEVNIQTNPVNSSQELLLKVPGLIIGQHAGGGKAEQIFLRGFDIDHGTDINITVDGMSVNMVSHAHGQGYADLHFLIPETVESLDFGKGPYYANQGNFTTAGYVDFRTKEVLEDSNLKLELGQFNTQRVLGMFNLLEHRQDHAAYVASEFLLTDGPFESPQNFSRINVMGKYTGYLNKQDKLSATVSYFTSKWDASGQVPLRAVESGLISRFGAIDDTEGGQTSRTNLLLNYEKQVSPKAFVKNTAYFTHYDFELYSNFTFFLNDPVYGDQIRQKESRQLFGLKSEYNQFFNLSRVEGSWQAGVGFRNDQSNDNELSHTLNRAQVLEYNSLGDIYETNLFAYASADFELGKWSLNPAIRIDQFKFSYNDQLRPQYQTQSETQSILSPKFNVLYNHSNHLQGYLKTGKGFHSNDTRVVVAQNGREILPAAYGTDLGFIWKPVPNILFNTAYWYLFLEQEFVYVGDEGIVEPSGKTRRQGIDFSMRHQPLKWLFWDLDVNYTLARSTESAEGEDFIPLAPDLTLMGGINIIHPGGFYGGLRARHIGDRPANEDNSIVAEGYTVIDLNSGYQWKSVEMGFSIQNLLNTEWNETQFATESRLRNEAAPVEEIHFIPGTPFFFKGTLTYKF